MLDRLDHSTHKWPLLPSQVDHTKTETNVSVSESKEESKTNSKVQPFWLDNTTNHSQAPINDTHSLDTGSLVESNQSSSRPVSGRMSGIRGQLLSRQSSEPCLNDLPLDSYRLQSRPVSGRMSGIRGELLSRQSSECSHLNPLSSMSDSSLLDTNNLHLVEDVRDGGVLSAQESKYEPRLKTATLAKGRRSLTMPDASESDYTVTSDHKNDIATPEMSQIEPVINSTHLRSEQPIVRQSLDECLASISKFDHFHLGQIGADMQGE